MIYVYTQILAAGASDVDHGAPRGYGDSPAWYTGGRVEGGY